MNRIRPAQIFSLLHFTRQSFTGKIYSETRVPRVARCHLPLPKFRMPDPSITCTSYCVETLREEETYRPWIARRGRTLVTMTMTLWLSQQAMQSVCARLRSPPTTRGILIALSLALGAIYLTRSAGNVVVYSYDGFRDVTLAAFAV